MCITHGRQKAIEMTSIYTMIIIHISFYFTIYTYQLSTFILDQIICQKGLPVELGDRVVRRDSGAKRQLHRHGYVCSHNHRRRMELWMTASVTNIIIQNTRRKKSVEI